MKTNLFSLKQKFLDNISNHLGYVPTLKQCEKWLLEAADQWECELDEDTLTMKLKVPSKYTHIGTIYFGDDHEMKIYNMLYGFIDFEYGKIVVDKFVTIHQPQTFI